MNLLITILAGYVALCLLVMWREPSMLYYPARAHDWTPADAGWAYEDVSLEASDSVRLHGWLIPGQRGSGLSAATPVVFLLHGNAGNISHRADKLAILRDLGADVFILDYRGYGKSEGKPNERGTYLDARAAYDYLTTRPPSTAGTRTPDPESQIPILYGESLGAAIAVELATTVPVAGVILEEPFTSAAEVGQRMLPFLPVRLLNRNKYDTLSKMSRLTAPLLILHSRQDEMFPLEFAERLLAAAPNPKRLVVLTGSHNDAVLVSGDIYRNALREFLERK